MVLYESSAVSSRQLPWNNNVRFKEGMPAVFDHALGRLCVINLDSLLNDEYSNGVCDIFSNAANTGLSVSFRLPKTSYIRISTVAISRRKQCL